jgi:hypothetical protein
MSEPNRTVPAPTGFSVRFPADVAEILHRTAYETGRTKLDLVSEAIRIVYGTPAERDRI